MLPDVLMAVITLTADATVFSGLFPQEILMSERSSVGLVLLLIISWKHCTGKAQTPLRAKLSLHFEFISENILKSEIGNLTGHPFRKAKKALQYVSKWWFPLELLKLSQITALARVRGKHRGRSDRACSCCCPLIQATCSPLEDTCNFSPGPRNGVEPKRGFHSGEVPKHDLHRADKWRIQTFILVLTASTGCCSWMESDHRPHQEPLPVGEHITGARVKPQGDEMAMMPTLAAAPASVSSRRCCQMKVLQRTNVHLRWASCCVGYMKPQHEIAPVLSEAAEGFLLPNLKDWAMLRAGQASSVVYESISPWERSQRCDTDVMAGGAAAVWQAKRKKRCYQSLKGISHNCSGIFFDTQMSFGGLGKTLTVRKTIAFDSPGMKRALRLSTTEDLERKLNVSNVQARSNGFGLHPTLHGEIQDLSVLTSRWAFLQHRWKCDIQGLTFGCGSGPRRRGDGERGVLSRKGRPEPHLEFLAPNAERRGTILSTNNATQLSSLIDHGLSLELGFCGHHSNMQRLLMWMDLKVYCLGHNTPHSHVDVMLLDTGYLWKQQSCRRQQQIYSELPNIQCAAPAALADGPFTTKKNRTKISVYRAPDRDVAPSGQGYENTEEAFLPKKLNTVKLKQETTGGLVLSGQLTTGDLWPPFTFLPADGMFVEIGLNATQMSLAKGTLMVKEQLWGCHPKDEQAGNSDPSQTFSKALQATDKRAQQQGPSGGSACRFVRLLKEPGEGHPGKVAANISPPESHINSSKVLQAEVRSAAKGSEQKRRPKARQGGHSPQHSSSRIQTEAKPSAPTSYIQEAQREARGRNARLPFQLPGAPRHFSPVTGKTGHRFSPPGLEPQKNLFTENDGSERWRSSSQQHKSGFICNDSPPGPGQQQGAGPPTLGHLGVTTGQPEHLDLAVTLQEPLQITSGMCFSFKSNK
ncbi:hypothetical protein Anapl_08078 [Anas platyrhynchos]|uniref:Uncharacterized protein n=1 Tax=Anas platyrhynchos TaxID=8839 RepID=R0JSK6_ANAPL|nr:hypothetical protein Anapl_08078 [Anas platyrhynchos]